MTTIRVNIDRLVIDGLSIGQEQGPRVKAAVQAELSRLLAQRGIAECASEPAERPAVSAAIETKSADTPAGLGQKITSHGPRRAREMKAELRKPQNLTAPAKLAGSVIRRACTAVNMPSEARATPATRLAQDLSSTPRQPR